MKAITSISLLALWLLSSAPQAAVPYFTDVREVTVASPGQQAYVVVDNEVWSAARRDLADLRLYAADGAEIPYALTAQQPATRVAESEVKILQPGTLGGDTQFVLDVSSVSEYNRVTLKLKTRDFIARATVEGQDDLHQARWVRLAAVTLYDFTREKLGSNSTLRLPDSRFRYLRVTIAGAVAPEDILGASVASFEEKQGAWTAIRSVSEMKQEGRTTVAAWDSPPNVPLERIEFDVDPAEVNFRREFKVFDADGRQVATGAVSRVKVHRAARVVDSETFAVPLSGVRSRSFRVVIENGDDPPLRLRAVKSFAVERRVYFNPAGKTRFKLYYGDPKLSAPVYDYAKFFRVDASAPAAALGPVTQNAAYTGRPDTRPWSERHPEVLWIAMLAAIAGLGGIAWRSLKS